MPNKREQVRRENIISDEFMTYCVRCKYHSNMKGGNWHFCKALHDIKDQFIWRENPHIKYKDEKPCPMYLEFIVSKP